MSEGIAVQEQRKRVGRNCRHHWVIETPHGVTSRGICKNCGTAKRFPNAADDALWEGRPGAVGRWSRGRGLSGPTKIVAPAGKEEE